AFYLGVGVDSTGWPSRVARARPRRGRSTLARGRPGVRRRPVSGRAPRLGSLRRRAPERHAGRSGHAAPGPVAARARRARESARRVPSPPRDRDPAGTATRRALLGSRVALSPEAVRRGALSLRRCAQQGRLLATRARGALWSRPV